MDFAIVWLLGAIVCIGSGVGGKYLKHNHIVLPLPIKVIGGMVVTIGVLFFILVQGFIISQMRSVGEPNLDYIIVLGAQVRGDVPSRALYSRIKKAGEYLEQNPRTKAVLSGGQGPGENLSEAQVMFNYLVEWGIEEERLIMEDKSTSTLENLEFSARLMEKGKHVGIVSQNFHIYRAIHLAKQQGYENVWGIASATEPQYLPHYMVREAFAVVKEKIVGNM